MSVDRKCFWCAPPLKPLYFLFAGMKPSNEACPSSGRTFPGPTGSSERPTSSPRRWDGWKGSASRFKSRLKISAPTERWILLHTLYSNYIYRTHSTDAALIGTVKALLLPCHSTDIALESYLDPFGIQAPKISASTERRIGIVLLLRTVGTDAALILDRFSLIWHWRCTDRLLRT